ncbi:hypothetical protein [Mycobacterium sp. IDR2000157661]|uniref:hypothetical protein n=1 Tax=Mycobacterium sp. IDR2000157661 TaxID=2867005 RepID=UPI001EEA20B6|nr:hypothetical protein [Mycobacterium sp. IDR2000157661]ULE33469.1 hypothetical protein K3G64_01780 [Mycobacterium sp. IDR2000157661]
MTDWFKARLGRMRLSTVVLIVVFATLFWVYQTFEPERAPAPTPAVVPPGFVPDPNYTWVPRTNVQRTTEPTETPTSTTTPPTPTTTTTNGPTTTTTITPTSPTTTVVDPDGPGPEPPTTQTITPTVSPSPGSPPPTPTTTVDPAN